MANISNTPPGQDSIKGGIFFGSNLTPSGSFQNVPNTTPANTIQQTARPSITLTLQKIKESLQNSASVVLGTNQSNVLSDQALNTFLTGYTQLLIDYEDLRNVCFFGSSYTELSYNIDYLIENYPFQAYIGRNIVDPTGHDLLTIQTFTNGTSSLTFRKEDILFPGNLNFDNSGNTLWNIDANNQSVGYDLVDASGNLFPILSFSNMYQTFISSINSLGINNFHIQIPQFKDLRIGDIVVFLDTTGTTKLGDGTITNISNNTDFEFTYVPIIVTTGVTFGSDIFYFTDNDLNINWQDHQWDGYGIKITTLDNQIYYATVTNSGPTGINSGIIYFNLPIILPVGTKYELYKIPFNGDILLAPLTIMSYIVEGVLSVNNFNIYSPTSSTVYKGLNIKPKPGVEGNFSTELTGIQKALLSPLNPTPWPRETITNNIITSGPDFDAWINNPYNMVKSWASDQVMISSDDSKYNLMGALTLDENLTNQLITKAIPWNIVSELNDTDQQRFTRYVLLAGKMFDTIKVYIDFLIYTHTLNYGQFNQLSPNFYKEYADHFGFTLLDEDNTNFVSSLILTESGLTYDAAGNPTFSDTSNKSTVQQLINEKQKRLLINLFYLYQKKGTIDCVKYLTSLLGTPEGLFLIKEYCFQQETSSNPSGLLVQNNKINVPQIAFEIDTNYLVDKTNINNPSNLPYVYKYKLSNQDIVNLREISIGLDVEGAIIDDLIKFGKLLYPYGYLGDKTYANLQSNSEYYFLPLSIPDKYSGISVSYNIPTNGFRKGVGTNQDEVSYNLCGLYNIGEVYYSTPIKSFENLNDGTVIVRIAYFSNFIPESLFITGTTTTYFPDGLYPITNQHHNETSAEWELTIAVPIDQFNVSPGPMYPNLATGTFILLTKSFDTINSTIKPLDGSFIENYRVPPIFFVPGSPTDVPSQEKLNIPTFPITIDILFVDTYGDGSSLGITFTSNTNSDPIILSQSTWEPSLKETVEKVVNEINITKTLPKFYASYIDNNNNTYTVTISLDTATVGVLDQPYTLGINRDGFDDPSAKPRYVIVSNANIFSLGKNYNDSIEYIVTRLEGNDIVVRLFLSSELSGTHINRIAIFKDYFDEDGLNHIMKLNFRPEGVEVYKDSLYLGLTRWRDTDSLAYPPYTPLNTPKAFINTLPISPLPDYLFATPNRNPKTLSSDKMKWWDLFVGYPSGIDMYIYNISIIENVSINQPDSGANESEKWIFDFTNQKKIPMEII